EAVPRREVDELELEVDVDRFALQLRRGALEPDEQLDAVDGVDRARDARRAADFVALQVPDQVPARARSELVQRGRLALELVDAILGEIELAQARELGRDLRRHGLGHGQERDLARRATGGQASLFDAAPDPCQVRFENGGQGYAGDVGACGKHG